MPTSVLLAVLAAAGLLALAPALTRRYDATERLAAERATSTARVLSRRRRRRTVPGRRPINPPRSWRLSGAAPSLGGPRRPRRVFAATVPGRVAAPSARSSAEIRARPAAAASTRAAGSRRARRGPAPPPAPAATPAPAPAGAARPGPAEPGRAGRGAAGRARLLDRVLGDVRGAAGLPGLPAPTRRGGGRGAGGPASASRLGRAPSRPPYAASTTAGRPTRQAAARRPSPSVTAPAGRPPGHHRLHGALPLLRLTARSGVHGGSGRR